MLGGTLAILLREGSVLNGKVFLASEVVGTVGDDGTLLDLHGKVLGKLDGNRLSSVHFNLIIRTLRTQ